MHALYTKSPLTPVECNHRQTEVQQMFVISQCKRTKLEQKQGSTSCPTEGAEEHDNIFSPQGGKLAKSEEIQPHHLIIQLILFSCQLAFAPLMQREGDYAPHMHRRNHSFPFFSLMPPLPLLFGLTFPLKSSAATRYLRIRSGCFGDILSVIRRRWSWNELCITPIAVCQKYGHHRQREKHTQTRRLRTFNPHGCTARGTSVLISHLRFLCKSASQAGQFALKQEGSNLGSLWKCVNPLVFADSQDGSLKTTRVHHLPQDSD